MDVLMVSKPVAPPWNDSSKNLVRDLASNMRRHRPTVLSRRGVDLGWPGVRVETPYGKASGGFSPALSDNARVLRRLLLGRAVDLWHFFFAPNPRSSRVAALAARLRRMRCVQTVCSAPADGADLASILFAERVVVLSKHSEDRLRAAGIEAARIRRIAPAVPVLEPPGGEQLAALRRRCGVPDGVPLLVYPGDLEFGQGAELSVAALAAGRTDAFLVLACRAKTERARDKELALRRRIEGLGCADRVRFVGEIPDILVLLAAADLVLLPADSLFAKMDLPLVLLEAMALGRPVLCAGGTPAQELAEGGAALCVEPTREAVVDAVGAALSDSARLAALGAAARDTARRLHSPSAMAQAYERLYDELA